MPNNNLSKEKLIKGIAVSPGLVEGQARVYHPQNSITHKFTGCLFEHESTRIKKAIQKATKELRFLSNQISKELSGDEAAVFEAQAMMMEDRELEKQYNENLRHGWNAEAAWTEAVELFKKKMENISDPALQARATDVRDIGYRVLRCMSEKKQKKKRELYADQIIIAEDLTPSETVDLGKSHIKAICIAKGCPSSHTAILARARGIPAVVGLGRFILAIDDGTKILVNGDNGSVIITHENSTRVSFIKEKSLSDQRRLSDLARRKEPALTSDGHKIVFAANVGNITGAREALDRGADGIGLFRTEFLFLNQKEPPDEQEQYQAYRKVLVKMGKLPVAIRTLDAGGDKEIAYLSPNKEANPFLGMRAIRICLNQPGMFRTQLRALLRAGFGCDLRIMFPMIATLEELRTAKTHLDEAKNELAVRSVPFIEKPKMGIMIEIPAAVVMAEQLAREVDFFSIGTNDLTQYTMAADRTNEKLAYLNDPCHPAVLRQISRVIEAGKKAGISTSICGEMAGDIEAIPILLGLEANELSMVPTAIPMAKNLIRWWSVEKARTLAEEALNKESALEVRRLTKI